MNNGENKDKKKVILVTDGDRVARKAVEKAAQNVGGRCISSSAGNPTPLPGKILVDLIKSAHHDPVLVMVDDRGHTGEGKGEKAIKVIVEDSDIDVIGAVAVASNTSGVNGVEVDCSITKDGNIIENTVDKCGNRKDGNKIYGDTVDILETLEVPVVIGTGDPGKMEGKDDCSKGAPIITKAVKEIIKRSGSEE